VSGGGVPVAGLIEDDAADKSADEAKLQVVVQVEHVALILPTAKVVMCVSTASMLLVAREWFGSSNPA
jgi:hypothetical protein